MKRERKSKEEAELIGVQLRKARKERGFTLEELQKATAVNAGQISRFEAGQFAFMTMNLQKVIRFLQNDNESDKRHHQLLQRFAALLDRSPEHKVAATALITALEVLH